MQRTDYDLLSIDEVARTIGQSAKTVRRMVRDGTFPKGFPAPTQLRWRWSTVRDWVIRQEIKAAEGCPNRDNSAHSGTNGPDDDLRPSRPKKER